MKYSIWIQSYSPKCVSVSNPLSYFNQLWPADGGLDAIFSSGCADPLLAETCYIRYWQWLARIPCMPHHLCMLSRDSLEVVSGGCAYLVDMGLEVSVIPPRPMHHSLPAHESMPHLQASNGSAIRTFGMSRRTLLLGSQPYSAESIVADVQHTLLGSDFLRTHRLLMDITGRQLVCVKDFSSVSCATWPPPSWWCPWPPTRICSHACCVISCRLPPQLSLPPLTVSVIAFQPKVGLCEPTHAACHQPSSVWQSWNLNIYST